MNPRESSERLHTADLNYPVKEQGDGGCLSTNCPSVTKGCCARFGSTILKAVVMAIDLVALWPALYGLSVLLASEEWKQ